MLLLCIKANKKMRHINYNIWCLVRTYTNTFVSPVLADIPCVAVNRCPGELILDTSTPNFSEAVSDMLLAGIKEDQTREID